MPHAIWSGSISFGLVTIPVSLVSAEERNDLAFHLLDGRNMAPVKQERVNSLTGERVEWDDIVRGYEYSDGSYVVVDDEDFQTANVEATRTIDILAMVRAEEIPEPYFDRPYYLAPASKAAVKPYALLRDTLREAGYVGVATIVIRTRQHISALIPAGDALVLDLLRWPHELRSADALGLPGDLAEIGVSDAEMKLARQLVEALASEWDPSAYRDTYRDDLLALIERKVATGEVEAPPTVAETPGEAAEVVDIMELLKRSLDAATGGKKGA